MQIFYKQYFYYFLTPGSMLPSILCNIFYIKHLRETSSTGIPWESPLRNQKAIQSCCFIVINVWTTGILASLEKQTKNCVYVYLFLFSNLSSLWKELKMWNHYFFYFYYVCLVFHLTYTLPSFLPSLNLDMIFSYLPLTYWLFWISEKILTDFTFKERLGHCGDGCAHSK